MAEILNLSRNSIKISYPKCPENFSCLIIRWTLYTLQLAGECITLERVTDFLYSIPTTEEQFDDDEWMNNTVFAQSLIKVKERVKINKVSEEDYQKVKKFWLFDYLAFQMTGERKRKFLETQDSLMMILSILGDAIKN